MKRTGTYAWAMAAATAISAGAHSDIAVVDLHWQFYQGGYVQDSWGGFKQFQDHIDGNAERSVVSHALEGATFQSTAAMQTDLVQHEGYLHFSALNELLVTASVEAEALSATAHAFAGLSAFTASFAITDGAYHYSGSEILMDRHGSEYAAGSMLAAGVYTFLEAEAFPELTQTPMVTAGSSEQRSSQRLFEFEFLAVPGPSALGLLAGALLRCCRRRTG